MSTEELLRDRLSDVVSDVEPRRVSVEEVAEAGRRFRRRQRSALGTVSVLATALIVGVAATVLPGTQASTPPVLASNADNAQLLAAVSPVVTKVLSSFHISPVNISVTKAYQSYDPSVLVEAGPVLPSKAPPPGTYVGTPGVAQQEFSLTITRHVHRIDLSGNVVEVPGQPPATGSSGTWTGGIRYALRTDANSASVQAELPVDVSVDGYAPPIVTGYAASGMTYRPNPLAGVVEAVTKAVAEGLPPMAHLPVPPQLQWVIGPNDSALTALQTAAASAPDVAATANILYFKAKVVDTRNQNDIEEIWLRRDDQPGAYYASGVQFGKVHGNYSGGYVWHGGIGTDSVDWNGLKNFPTDVAGLEKLFYDAYGENPQSSGSLIEQIEALAQESPASPELQASLAVLAGRLPGATVTPHTTDPLGRPAVAIQLGGVSRIRLLFSPTTGTLLTSEELTTTGAVLQYRAVTQVAAVTANRIRPDGTKPQIVKTKK